MAPLIFLCGVELLAGNLCVKQPGPGFLHGGEFPKLNELSAYRRPAEI